MLHYIAALYCVFNKENNKEEIKSTIVYSKKKN